MSQFVRLLLLTPAVFSSVMSLVIAARSAHATTAWVEVSKGFTCMQAPTKETKQLVCKRVNAAPGGAETIDLTKAPSQADSVDVVTQTGNDLPDTFEMTDEESDVAVALFGCDCPVCIRSLRQLRSMTS